MNYTSDIYGEHAPCKAIQAINARAQKRHKRFHKRYLEHMRILFKSRHNLSADAVVTPIWVKRSNRWVYLTY